MRPQAIHQFHAGSKYGDGVTNGMLFTQKLLRRAGYVSEIFCANVDPKLGHLLRPMSAFENVPDHLTLVHYSHGHDHHRWIENISGPKILIYHNITPAHFFPAGSAVGRYAQLGREQLAAWAKSSLFNGAMADSGYNAEELLAFGYRDVETIPLLVDLDAMRSEPFDPRTVSRFSDGAKNLLFVGRWAENKGQLDLVRVMRHVVDAAKFPVRLILAGDTTSPDYREAVLGEIDRLGLGSHVEVLHHLRTEEVRALYRVADAYVSLSRHEGFGMPLVEAMACGVPVVALAEAAVPYTLGSGGVLLDTSEPAAVAATIRLLLGEPWLRREVVTAQNAELERFEAANLVARLQGFLQGRGYDVDLATAERASAPRAVRIEGPLAGSYSLAVVNRSLARALAAGGNAVQFVSRDGPGLIEPPSDFLAANPDLREMWLAGQGGDVPAATLRNQYPPHVAGMKGDLRGLACYAWEESAFPQEHVGAFNHSLDLITVTSRFVKKVLRDNGVRTPIAVVGNGVDHLPNGVHDEAAASDGAKLPFRFLHVSSAFPRKGVDVLLKAWGMAFTQDDAVRLTIKTFPNPHNEVERQLKTFSADFPLHAPVELINEDLPEGRVAALIAQADAVVCPSRGEGFGLPLAEAMLAGKPVITTAYGGQSDFCTAETAWLCDYRFAYAETHLGLADSVWTEPDATSLADCLRAVAGAPAAELQARAAKGQALIAQSYRWGNVAERVTAAMDAVRALDSRALRLPKIGMVSTWNSRCGIAIYAESLASAPGFASTVFANHNAELLGLDGANVVRCWEQGWGDTLDELYQKIREARLDAVVIQFNFGFFRLDALSNLIRRLDADGVDVYITLHSTADVDKPDVKISLKDAQRALALTTRIFVHSIHDLNRLKGFGLVENVALFPMGIPAPVAIDRETMRRDLGVSDEKIVASFGFLLPHKGIRQLIEAAAGLIEGGEKVHLLLLNSIYPAGESQQELAECKSLVKKLKLESRVTFVNDFLEENEIIRRLSCADLVVFPYQHTQESGSAAVRLGLSSLAPVACTPLQIFDDVAPVSYRFKGTSVADIAEGIRDLFADPAKMDALRARQAEWVQGHSWTGLSERLHNLIRGEAIDRLMS
ncbi:MAG TPA: glycosyltransferase [Xanthobacteraceae bacterium]|nr:glycosyltransferase [Xanthobacteraceae bacterium]